MKEISLIFLIVLSITSCSNPDKIRNASALENSAQHRFELVPSSVSNLTFNNKIEDSYELNFLNYPYLYNGGGLAVADFDKDGLEDIYFSGNQTQNKLYHNQGDLSFKDITVSSLTGNQDGFSTGVMIIDANNDGWPDIYVCRAASLKDPDKRRNLLYINQKDLTFKEEAREYGLDDPAFSTQAYSPS